VYLIAYAEAMGQHAALLAAQDCRTVITEQDIDIAAAKLRGYMPIAGRWCPL
jgi:histone H3/H4